MAWRVIDWSSRMRQARSALANPRTGRSQPTYSTGAAATRATTRVAVRNHSGARCYRRCALDEDPAGPGYTPGAACATTPGMAVRHWQVLDGVPPPVVDLWGSITPATDRSPHRAGPPPSRATHRRRSTSAWASIRSIRAGRAATRPGLAQGRVRHAYGPRLLSVWTLRDIEALRVLSKQPGPVTQYQGEAPAP